MRIPLSLALVAVNLLGVVSDIAAQTPASPSQPPALLYPANATSEAPPQQETGANPEKQLSILSQNAVTLQQQQAAAQAAPAPDVKKQLELLQKQIETQQQMIQLLRQQIGKTPPAAAPVQKLEDQTATLEARAKQAAQRDVELAQAIDTLHEHQDSQERYGPWLPAPLKELFLPSGNNETPLSIYGALAFGYSHIQHQPGGFYFGEFTPDFFLKLNDWIFLAAEIGVGSDGTVNAGGFLEADFFVTDWLTISAGRIVAPIGWYNLRSNNPWVTKTPTDAPGSQPLLWQQVLPTLSLLGVEASGSFYLGSSPFKLDYSAYVSNGLNLTPATPGSPTISELANLENMTDTFTFVTNEKAVGGRLGLWWPAMGLEAGVSGLYNGDYVAGGFEESFGLWAVDFNYRQGNWDVRLEGGMSYQQAGSFLGANIKREGLTAQVAYRPYDASCRYLRNLEAVYRYGYVCFPGIDVNELDLTTFATPVDVPTRRQQNQFGLNYYFYQRLVLKCAYQINDEPHFHLHDNQFIAELAWGW
jgi:hypothetical protein